MIAAPQTQNRRASRILNETTLTVEEEEVFRGISSDPEVRRVLPVLRGAGVVVVDRRLRGRFEKTRPLQRVCERVSGVDDASSGLGIVDEWLRDGLQRILVLVDLDRESCREMCRGLRKRSKSGVFPCIITASATTIESAQDVLRECVALGCIGYLTEPIHMGQLILTLGQVLKRTEAAREAGSGIGREETKRYPIIRLVGLGMTLGGNLATGSTQKPENDVVELCHVAKDQNVTMGGRNPITDEGSRPKLMRATPQAVSADPDAKDPSKSPSHTPSGSPSPTPSRSLRMTPSSSKKKFGSSSKSEPPAHLGYSAEMQPHIVKDPPPISSPRSTWGFSRSKVQKALSLVSMQERAKLNRRANRIQDSAKMLDNIHKDRRNAKSNESLPEHSAVRAGSPWQRKKAKLQKMETDRKLGLSPGRKGLRSKRSALKADMKVVQSRKASMEAPVRPTIAMRMAETLATHGNHGERPKTSDVFRDMKAEAKKQDSIQFTMVEIEPPFNKSSRSAHFIAAGYKEYREGNLFDAINTFTKAIEANGKSWLAHFWRGVTFDSVGGFVRSLRDLTTSIKLRTRQAIEEAGDDYDHQNSSSKTANSDFEEPPELAAIYFNRAIVYTHIGDDGSAHEDLTSAIKRDPSNHIFRHNRAMIARRLGNYVNAQGDYVKLWMERKINRLTTSPAGEFPRPRTMSSFHPGRAAKKTGTQGGSSAVEQYLTAVKSSYEPQNRFPLAPSSAPPRASGDVPFTPIISRKLSYDDGGDESATKITSMPSLDLNTYAEAGGDMSTVAFDDAGRADDSIVSLGRDVHDDWHGSSNKSLTDGSSGIYVEDTLASDGATALESKPSFKGIGDDSYTEAVRPRLESQNSLDSMMTPIRPTSSALIPPSTTKSQSNFAKSKLDLLADDMPSEQPIHLMDPRQLTDMFFQITTAEKEAMKSKEQRKKERAEKEKEENRDEKGGAALAKKGLLDVRIDLNEFKRQVGAGSGDIHEEIFHKPDAQQLALLVEPGERKAKDIDVIINLLRTTDLCNGLSTEVDEELREVAQWVEYRALTNGSFIFQQGEEVNCCCVLWTGSISVKSESTNGAIYNLGEVKEGEHFGDQFMLMTERGTGKGNLAYQSYVCDMPCQVLIILEEQMRSSCLLNRCGEEYRTRGRLLAGTCMFEQWSMKEVFDLACLSKSLKRGKDNVIIEQGEPSEFLCVLRKGLCRVTKFADRAAQILRNIADLNKELKRLQAGYTFHHTLRDRAKVKSEEDGWFDIEEDSKPFQTITESEQEDVTKQIAMWESRLRKLEREGGDTKDRRLKVGSLVSGDVFGESSVLEPIESLSVGGVESESNCEIIMIHKSILLTYDFTGTDEFLDKVRRRAPIYPEDNKLIEDLQYAEEWIGYKQNIMKGIKKTRWPVDGRRIRKVTGGSVIMPDLETKFTKHNV